MKNLILLISTILFISQPVLLLADEDNGFHWPKEIEKKNTTVTLY